MISLQDFVLRLVRRERAPRPFIERIVRLKQSVLCSVELHVRVFSL